MLKSQPRDDDAALTFCDQCGHLQPGLHPVCERCGVPLDRSVYDCLYLSLAIARDCTVVTADQKFAAVVTASPFADRLRLLG